MDTIITTLARELGRDPVHVENVVRLIDEGNTIPFIARYRKELHGAMDDTALRTLADRLQYLRNLDKRREEVKASIEGQGKLTEALAAAIDAAATLAEVEDLYLPYKPKRRTRATMAKEKGLEPLADALFAKGSPVDPAALAADFIDPEKGVETVEDALQGASDIIAEAVSDDAAVRKALRELYLKGFEIAVREARPRAIMTSYNLINGVHAANCYDLCTKVARCEFGFTGLIMTDWTTTNIDAACTAAGCILAGNDVVMPGMAMDHASIRAALADDSLTEARLRWCITHLVRVILQADRYE